MDEALQVFGDLPDAVRLVARDGRTLVRNEASRILGEEGLGHSCAGAGRRDPSCPGCQIAEVFDKGLFLRWHVTREGSGALRDYYEVTLSPVRDADGDVAAVLEIVRDATATLGVEQYLIGRSERQEVEIQKQSEELGNFKKTQTDIVTRDRLTALSLLVQSLSHEIHTPLGAMLSSADLLERSMVRLESELSTVVDVQGVDIERRLKALRRNAAVLVEGARRVQGVLRTLRLFTRLDEAETKQVDLHEGIDSTLELLQYRMGGRIEVKRQYGQLPLVTCRPDACNQVFMNLLINATQAIQGPGVIRIATAHRGDEVLVRISDDGVGIPEDAQERIFDLGFTTRAAERGTGIGLALSRSIVEEHGGSLEVESEPGHGSTFTIRLPLGPLDDRGDS